MWPAVVVEFVEQLTNDPRFKGLNLAPYVI
jgi:hypothetical protein